MLNLPLEPPVPQHLNPGFVTGSSKLHISNPRPSKANCWCWQMSSSGAGTRGQTPGAEQGSFEDPCHWGDVNQTNI